MKPVSRLGQPRDEPLDAVSTVEAHPLSPDQEPLWFLDRLRGGNAADHLSRAWQLEGPLDAGALERAIAQLIQRHDVLRSSFHENAGKVTQRIRCGSEPAFERIDLSGLETDRQFAAAAELAAEKARLPFDLENGPPVRATLFALGEARWIFLVVLHHLVGDDQSFEIVVRELNDLYAVHAVGAPSHLPEFDRRYADFARERRREVDELDLDALRASWIERLDGFGQVVELPLDRVRPPVQSSAGERVHFALAPADGARLRAVAHACDASLLEALLALVFVLLKRHTGQSRLAVGTPVSLRDQAAYPDLIGMFLAMAVVDVDLADDPCLADLITRTRDRARGAFAAGRLPFPELVRAVHPGRDLSRNPVFQVMVQLSGNARLELAGIRAVPFDFDPKTAQFDLSFHFHDAGEGIRGYIEFDADLFDRRTIEALRDRLLTLIGPDGLDPERRVGALRIMTAEEEERVLRVWNRTDADYPHDVTIHRLFEQQVRRTPERLAVRAGSQEMSYGLLNVRANQLARQLRQLGLGPGVFAGICMRRTVDMVVAVLAVLKTGGAYLPLDPSFPRERLDLVIDDSGAPLVITDLGDAAPFERAGRTVIDLDRPDLFDEPEAGDLDLEVSSRELAYLIYTSGSTGRPKGVQIEHRSVVNFLYAMRHEPGLSEDDRLLAVTTLSFDISVLELFLPLITGAQLIVVDQATASDGEMLKRLLASSGATVMQATPSTWRMLLDSGWRDQTGLKKLAGGEAMPGALADALAGMPGSLWNMYGPTETTIWSAVRKVEAGVEVRVGGPIANTRFYVVDGNMVPVPEGVPGELLIGGDGVARGYWLRDELTAERFVEDPFEPHAAGRLYRTGDLVRLRADGSLSFLGRLDRQVKVRGFRIELGDIEQTVLATGMVKDALVVTRDADGDTILVAYLVERPDGPADLDALRKELRAKLPHYMVPSAFVTLEAWPLTPNGKVDHKRLPAPERRRSSGAALVTAGNATERTVLEVWRKLLKLDEVGVDDNFFDLGGHSLLLAQMREELAQHFGRRLTLPDLFRLPTVRMLANELAAESGRPQAVTGDAARAAAAGRKAAARCVRTDDQRQDEERIAVIGMAGRFPGARTVAELWENLKNGVESIRRFDDGELRARGVPDHLLADSRYVKAGTVLDEVEMFDAEFFGMSPREAALTDPQQRLFLEASWAALEDAGYCRDGGPLAAGVFAGVGQNGYVHGLAAEPTGDYALDYLKTIGNEKDYLASRVAYHLNLTGPALVVQATCATSLVAVHLACEHLLAHQSDLALAGGVGVLLPQGRGYLHQDGMLLSPDGHCRAFDARAGGYVPGRGLGVVVLKRLSEALADGDRIDAVIRGSAVNNDGALKVGFAALSVDGQADVVASALARAGVPAETVHYVEAFGGATPLGDAIEIEALTRAFRAQTTADGFCRIGSLKTNIGHLDVAAGVAGLIKAALIAKTGDVPPSLHFERPNPEIDFARTPFVVTNEPSRLEPSSTPRRVGVSSFGVGGTNAHVILEEPPAVAAPGSAALEAAPALIVLSAKTEGALDQASARLADHLEASPDIDLRDAAWTLQIGRRHFAHRRMMVAHDVGSLVAELRRPQRPRVSVRSGAQVVFAFAGEALKDPAPALDLYRREPVFKEALDGCAGAAGFAVGADPGQRLLDSVDAGSPGQRLALFALEHALARFWIALGVAPAAMLSHGSGVLAAACIGNVLSLDDALKLILDGSKPDELPLELHRATIPIIAVTDAAAPDGPLDGLSVSDGIDRVATLDAAISAVLEPANRIALEVGPPETLAPHLRAHDAGGGERLSGPLTSLPLARQPVDAATHLREVLGQLWLAGLQPDFEPLYPKPQRRVALPTYPFARVPHWLQTAGDDRRAIDLPVAAPSGRQLAVGARAPRTHAERTLAAIFADVLGVEGVGFDDDFFHLGGDSLMALSVAGRAREAGLNISPQQLVKTPTVDTLALVANAPVGAGTAAPSLSAGDVPLTPFLARFLKERGEHDPHRWNLSTITTCKRRLDPTVVERAIEVMVERHDSLRLRVTRRGATWTARIVPPGEAPACLEVVDLSRLPDDDVPGAIEARAEQEQGGLHLGTGPIMRTVLFDLGPERPQRLLVVVHHFALDGFAWMVLFDHLEHYYAALESGHEPEPAPRPGMKDWADDLARFAGEDARRQDVAMWQSLPWSALHPLPQDHPADRAMNTNGSAEAVKRRLPRHQTARLLRSPARGLQAETVMIAALGQALARFQGRPHVLIERLFQGRNVTGSALDLSTSLGSFLCYAPCLLQVDPEAGVVPTIKAVDEQMRGPAGQGAMIDLVRFMAADREPAGGLARLPRADVLFNYRGRVDGMLERSRLFSPAPESAGSDYDPEGRRYYPLAIRIDIVGGELDLTVVYSRNLHRRETAERLTDDILDFIRAAITEMPPEGALS